MNNAIIDLLPEILDMEYTEEALRIRVGTIDPKRYIAIGNLCKGEYTKEEAWIRAEWN